MFHSPHGTVQRTAGPESGSRSKDHEPPKTIPSEPLPLAPAGGVCLSKKRKTPASPPTALASRSTTSSSLAYASVAIVVVDTAPARTKALPGQSIATDSDPPIPTRAMPSSENGAAMTAKSMDGFTLDGCKGSTVTFDARVNSVLEANSPEQRLLELRLGERALQAFVDATAIPEAVWNRARDLTPESIIRVTGHVQSGRVCVTNLDVIAYASPNLPPCRSHSLGLEARLSHRILDVRRAASGAMFKLHSAMCQLIVEFLCSNGFHWIHTPRIITATIPGDNEYFHLPYFGKDAWLAQSSQHHKQMALSMDMQRVFEIGPVFRAEVKSSKSMRHMTEFTVLDIAMTFEDDYHEVVDLVESMLLFVFGALQERRPYGQLVQVVKDVYPGARPFRIGLDEHGKVPRVTFLEAKRILREELGLESDDGKNFTDQEEAALGRHFLESSRLGNTDVFTIERYPASMRQFNSQASPDAPGLSNTWDTIVGGREVCSGSQRINSYDELREAMRAGICGPPMDPDADKWQPYLAAFKTGMPRHGGCGLGVNRLLQGFLGLDDVREVTLFPRDVNTLTP
ncbi:aspartate-tRNA ligase [Metarhizium album ARSEF 1941]|uniref:aspartate--tRNA ligase n=1 Tax=Metarhizium album (strain ARSEF 1941) TaxID=1081103 RepID=A0A0B2WKD9_METAS|nr:aspartate-tRNA ligase [Metarhizium album ARSEF 1941]KHN94388.1 aspartate-tRNA ligase [Metarhizium album ARSEF 1941]